MIRRLYKQQPVKRARSGYCRIGWWYTGPRQKVTQDVEDNLFAVSPPQDTRKRVQMPCRVFKFVLENNTVISAIRTH